MIEDPFGLFRGRDYGKPFLRFLKPTSYCQYSGFKYEKFTDIFSNVNCTLPHCRSSLCEYKLTHGRHAETAQRGSSSNGTPGNTLEDLHRVPHELVQKLFRSAFFPAKEAIASYLPGDVPARESRELVKAVNFSRRSGGVLRNPGCGFFSAD